MHYYEDGNVRLTTSKPITTTPIPDSGSTAAEVMRHVAAIEKRYQEELNKGFTALSEGSFKNLRRQLPVTRQKLEWEKVGGYRVSYLPLITDEIKVALEWELTHRQLGQDIGGGRQR